MLTDADKKNLPSGVDFQQAMVPDAAALRYVSDGHVDSWRLHARRFRLYERRPAASGEICAWREMGSRRSGWRRRRTWQGIGKDLIAQYSSDYLKEWRQFLLSAHVAGCGGLKEAPKELAVLSGPTSPILELFAAVSRNTAVADPQIKSVFHPAQWLVDPNAIDRLIGGNNKDYITAPSRQPRSSLLDQAASSESPSVLTDPADIMPQWSHVCFVLRPKAQCNKPPRHSTSTRVQAHRPVDCQI